MTDIIIYAELLLNIRQITVVASLPSAHNNKTIVTLSEDRQSLSVTHDGLNSVVKLPAPVRPGFNPTIAPGSTKALSFRLPIADDVANSLSSRGNTHGVQSPWSAASMEPTTRVACRFCWTLLVKEQVKSWKDLPSENWAEMMDFWHCHKPDTHDDEDLVHKQDGVRKGYGAASILRPTSGVGLVDITSFHLTQWDCNIKVGEDPVMLKVSVLSLWSLNASLWVASWQQEGGLSFIHNGLVADTIARNQDTECLRQVYPLHHGCTMGYLFKGAFCYRSQISSWVLLSFGPCEITARVHAKYVPETISISLLRYRSVNLRSDLSRRLGKVKHLSIAHHVITQ